MGRWKNSIIQDFTELLEVGSKFGFKIENTSVLGASFGGALALLLKHHFELKNVFLSSPLLDLEDQKRRAGDEYKDWFASRFSAQDHADFTFDSLTTNTAGVFVTFGEDDEVLGSENFARLKNCRVIRRSGGHVPKTYREYLAQREFFSHI